MGQNGTRISEEAKKEMKRTLWITTEKRHNFYMPILIAIHTYVFLLIDTTASIWQQVGMPLWDLPQHQHTKHNSYIHKATQRLLTL